MIVEVGVEDWAVAALVGQARRLSNEKLRGAHRDRGVAKNVQNDLIGSLGEILAYKYFGKFLSDSAKTQQNHQLFSLGGGSNHRGADFYLDLHSRKPRLDVKTFDCDSRKRFFAINAKKHRSLKAQCEGYTCLMIPLYGKEAVLEPFLSYNAVSDWNEASLGSYGDSSFNLPINDFLRLHSDAANYDAVKRAGVFTRDDIKAAVNSHKVRSYFYSLCPDAKSLIEGRC
ncbi:hypothetical protein OTK49_01195 [Vibrio coralliirubri]|uniref:hypothetical protein n=1 Tax=Vibrio coralliirubri TaxID=1516159 RepID=UPI002284AD75|nr:hypothetical protein [Vibrio coralliirubri]MCY9861145.1 hypothetical protein [Vibrio coralliirubri]